MRRARIALTSLALAAVAAAAPASAKGALTKAERRAVDVVSIDGASTGTAALAEIGFRGRIDDLLDTGALRRARVTIVLAPTSGPSTTVTVRGGDRKSKEKRSGTKGSFDVSRDGHTVLVLVEGLSAPTSRIVVTTSGPSRVGAHAGGSKDGAKPVEYDELISKAQRIADEGELRTEIADKEELIAENAAAIERKEKHSDITVDEIQMAKKLLSRADTAAEAGVTRERVERLNRELEKLTAERQALRQFNKLWTRWLQALRRVRQGGEIRQCNDGGDNADPEDKIADHPADPGCTGPLDNDEKDIKFEATCPPDNATVAHTIDVYTLSANTIAGGRLTTAAGEIVALATGLGPDGPRPLPTSICGPDTTTFFSFGAGPFAPNDLFGTLSPPPGNTGARFVIELANPPGGSPGGQSFNIFAALDTRFP